MNELFEIAVTFIVVMVSLYCLFVDLSVRREIKSATVEMCRTYHQIRPEDDFAYFWFIVMNDKLQWSNRKHILLPVVASIMTSISLLVPSDSVFQHDLLLVPVVLFCTVTCQILSRLDRRLVYRVLDGQWRCDPELIVRLILKNGYLFEPDVFEPDRKARILKYVQSSPPFLE